MTSLGLGADQGRSAEVGMSFRTGWLKHVGVVLSGASGAAIVMGGYEVLKTQPDRAFGLLQAWGPSSLVVIVALFVVGKFLEGLNQTVRESFSVVASGVSASAEAQGRTADALTKLADQGNKQAEEVRRLAIYAARQFPAVYERFDQVDATIKVVADSMKELHHRLSKGDREDEH